MLVGNLKAVVAAFVVVAWTPSPSASMINTKIIIVACFALQFLNQRHSSFAISATSHLNL